MEDTFEFPTTESADQFNAEMSLRYCAPHVRIHGNKLVRTVECTGTRQFRQGALVDAFNIWSDIHADIYMECEEC